MKLVTTSPVVQKNTISAVPVQRYDDGSARALAQAGQIAAQIGNVQARGNEMAGQAYGVLARGVGQLGAVIQHQQEEQDALNVQAASNEYTKRLNDVLYNQDNGLMNTQMQGADGITAQFEAAERKIRQEVGQQFKFHTAKGINAYNRMTDNSATQRFEMVRRHQTQQYNA